MSKWTGCQAYLAKLGLSEATDVHSLHPLLYPLLHATVVALDPQETHGPALRHWVVVWLCAAGFCKILGSVLSLSGLST